MSKTDKKITRLIIKSIDLFYFFNKNGCLLINLDGRKAYIKIEDALSYLTIFSPENNFIASYDNVNTLINDGWKVAL